eukprot:Gb_02265 [translate_table: standard]
MELTGIPLAHETRTGMQQAMGAVYADGRKEKLPDNTLMPASFTMPSMHKNLNSNSFELKILPPVHIHMQPVITKLKTLSMVYKISKYLHVMFNVHLPKVFGRSDSMDPWSKDSNWMDYVAVSTDEETKHLGRRDIVVAWAPFSSSKHYTYSCSTAAIGSFRFVNRGIECLRMQEYIEIAIRRYLTAPLIEDDS